MSTPRYAIYYTPPPFSRLAQFGAGVLGYDGFRGADVPHTKLTGVDPVLLSSVTAEPRRYGFHATIVAPFYLDRHTEADVAEELLLFTQAHGPVPVGPLVVATFSQFVGLMPAEPQNEIAVLAEDCLKAFDRYRKPLSAEDRERRSGASLTSHQAALMDRWGYPYVLDQFRFHMTLAGPIAATHISLVSTALSRAYARLARNTIELDSLSLVRQDRRDQSFKLIERFRLRGQF